MMRTWGWRRAPLIMHEPDSPPLPAPTTVTGPRITFEERFGVVPCCDKQTRDHPGSFWVIDRSGAMVDYGIFERRQQAEDFAKELNAVAQKDDKKRVAGRPETG